MISLSVHLYNIKVYPCSVQSAHLCLHTAVPEPAWRQCSGKKAPHGRKVQAKALRTACFVVQMKIGYGTFATTYHDIVDFIFPTDNTQVIILPFQFFFYHPLFKDSSASHDFFCQHSNLFPVCQPADTFFITSMISRPTHGRISLPFVPAMIVSDSHYPSGSGAIARFKKPSPLLSVKQFGQFIKSG